jgi:protein-disulfide isomerase
LKNLGSILTAALLLPFTGCIAIAQSQAMPAAPAAQNTPSVPVPLAPPPPAANTAPIDPFPSTSPRYFTASSPAPETVNSFLHAMWGFDPSRIWRVMAIMPTAAPGVSKVVAFVSSKAPDAKIQSAIFYITPDGKHAIGQGSGVIPFGADPFEPLRSLLKERANGAARGAPGKELEFVEFADLQCPVCKQAQSTVDQLVHDFPNAHVVFQLFPLVDIHSSAFKAAAYGICAQKQSDDAFFKYAAGVFDTQEALTPTTDDTLLRAAALRAGLDGDAIAACSKTPATHDAVSADIKLAEDAGVEQTPMLSVNGRLLPLGSEIPYDTLKQLIQFQATLDGVNSGATPETLAPKPAPPTLQSLPK